MGLHGKMMEDEWRWNFERHVPNDVACEFEWPVTAQWPPDQAERRLYRFEKRLGKETHGVHGAAIRIS